MLIVFQILLVLFALVAIANVFSKRKDQVLGPKGFVFWLLFWLAVILVAIWPDSAQRIADHLGIGRGADLVIYISVAMIFFVLFRLHVKVEGLKRDLTRVVREDALEIDNKTLKNKS